jgi:hypothetical protein
MNLKKWAYILLFMALIGGATGLYGYRFYLQEQERLQIEAEQKAIADARNAFDRDLRAIMDGFVKDISMRAADYRKQKKFMTELAQPANLTTAQYIMENYQLITGELPVLKTQAEAVLNAFDGPEAAIAELIARQTLVDKTVTDKALSDWQNFRRQRATAFVDRFSQDQQILDLYVELLLFYSHFKNNIFYDRASDSFLFQNPDDKAAEQALLANIAALEKKSEPPAPTAAPPAQTK